MKSKVLIIDDDTAVLEILCIWLAEEGFDVEVRSSTNDVIGLLRSTQPDIVLLDYLLEGINGGELCRQIKNDQDYQHLPVVIFSALHQHTLSLELSECDAYISKPFDLYGLTTVLDDLISTTGIHEC